MNIWEGDKIRLRAVEMRDLEDYFCKEEQLDTVSIRKGDRLIFPISKVMMKERVESLSKTNPYSDEYFLIIEDKQGNSVGNINTHSCSRIDGTFQYGLGIKSEYRGNGYAQEAIKLLIRYYFMEQRFHKVETRVYSFNRESIGLHHKLGFVLEGTLRKSHFALGDWYDIICFGMLKEEFSSLFPELIEGYV